MEAGALADLVSSRLPSTNKEELVRTRGISLFNLNGALREPESVLPQRDFCSVLKISKGRNST